MNLVTDAEFVAIWNSSASAREVADKLHVSRSAVNIRAFKLRKTGVELKAMRVGRPRLDTETTPEGGLGTTRRRVSPEEFVVAWNTSRTAREAADKLGMPKLVAHARASKYRKAGVKLKAMRRGGRKKLDVEGLNKILEELEKKSGV